MPAVVAQEQLVALADIAVDNDPFATRLELNAEAMAQELQADGQINAIYLLATPDTPPYQTLAGHRRVGGARLCKWTHIRVIIHTNLSHEEAWRLVWKDNAERKSLSQADRWWVVARLLAEGRNQVTVAALFGVSPLVVSRDAGWTWLPEAVRHQLGKDGFSFGHAAQLIPYADDLNGGKAQTVLKAYRKAPSDVAGFRKLVQQLMAGRQVRWPAGLRVAGDRLHVDLGNVDVVRLSPEQVAATRALVGQLMAALNAVSGFGTGA